MYKQACQVQTLPTDWHHLISHALWEVGAQCWMLCPLVYFTQDMILG